MKKEKDNARLDRIGNGVDEMLPEGSSWILVFQSPEDKSVIVVHCLESDQAAAQAIRELAKGVDVSLSDA